ncbi:hypothetical protein J1N35_033561 [Gossypium stocksii]|uniref:Uncharacterized protein n=1 Tax=Gossypium stocksii TaxID=47602 RepID=A0A9D3UQL8_9ROSI|nr:hypothetical protein J1N35_033561 [Gossypium stocksii]
MVKLRDQNIAFLIKLGYKLVSDEEAIWKDRWIPNVGLLINYLPTYANVNTDCLLRNLITRDGNWNISFLQEWLPKEIISHILGIPPPHPDEGPDRLAWRHTSTGAFSVKSAYTMLKADS